MSEKTKVAVIGLGSMGYGMASSCLRAGLETYGYDVNKDAEARFITAGGKDAPLPDAIKEVDVALIVVLNAAQTEAVLFGDNGIATQMAKGSVVISSATVSPDFAREMEAKCVELGLHYLDAPISGGSLKAASGDLTIMASGSGDAFARAKTVLDAISATVFTLGDCAGPGSAMKATNQLLAGVHIVSMAEALTFGMTQGITPEKFLEVISQSAGTSWMLENRAPHIVEGDYTPRSTINIWPKDLGIVLEIAKGAKFSAPITAAAMQQYLAAAGMGLGLEDDAAVAKVYARNAGLTLPKEDE